MPHPDTVRSIVGIFGSLSSFILFGLPMPTIWRMFKNKSVEEFDFHLYVAGIMNCLMWFFYSMPFVHPHSVLVTITNSVGFVLYVAYISIYWSFADKKKRKSVVLYVIGEFIGFAALACITLLVFHTETSRSTFVGIFCDVFGIIFYGSPLPLMWKVINGKSVEFVPPSLFVAPFASFSNGFFWSCYALIRFDIYILIGNGIGVLFGFWKLFLHPSYDFTTPKNSKQSPLDTPKPSQVQLATATVSGPSAV